MKKRFVQRRRHTKKRQQRWIFSWKKVLFSLVPLIVLFSIAELVVRFIPHQNSGNTHSGFVIPDPELIWRLTPAKVGPFATNELGLRDTSYNGDADKKILLLGDSVSWADGLLDLRQAYPYLLECGLEGLDPSTTYEVINCGVPGYSTFQECDYLKLHGLQLQPDLVVLQFCLNDVFERYHTLATYGGDNTFLGIDTRQAASGVHGFLWKYSRSWEHMFRFLQTCSRKREEYDVRKMAQNSLSKELEQAWRHTLVELEEIRQITDDHDIPLLLVIAPYRFQLNDPRGNRQPQDRLLAYARQHDLPCVDLLPLFAEEKRLEPLFNDPSHFSSSGHRLAAKKILEPVRQALESH